jgi:hypothetical protein
LDEETNLKTKQANENLCISNFEKGFQQHKQYFETKLVKNKRFCTSTSSNFPNSESITEVLSRRKDNYFDNTLLKRLSIVKLIKKPDYFDYTTGEIRKCVNKGKGYDLESLNAYLLRRSSYGPKIKEFCELCNLLTITLEKLRILRHPCFLLLQKMFCYRGISIIDAYLHGITETTLTSYRSGWKTFIYFLIKENYNNIHNMN